MPDLSKKRKKSRVAVQPESVEVTVLPNPGDIIAEHFKEECTSAQICVLENSPFAEAFEWIKPRHPLESPEFLEASRFNELLFEKVPAGNALHLTFNCYDLVLVMEFAPESARKWEASDNLNRFKIDFQSCLFTLVRLFNAYQSGLNRLYQAMLSSSDMETIFPALVEELSKIIKFERLSLVTYHPEFESFCIEAEYDHQNPNCSFMKQFIRINDTNISRLLENKGGSILDYSDPGHGTVAKRLIRQGLQSFMYNPICDKGELIASLNMASIRKNAYDQSDLKMISGICNALSYSFKAAINHSRLEQAAAEYREAQKHFPNLEKARNFIDITRGVLHSFNNHLALIMGRAQILRQFSGEVIKRENLEKGLDIILNASTRASEQIAELQKYARLKPDSEPDRIQIKGLIEEIIELSMPRWKAVAHGGIKFDINADEQLHFIGFRRAVREALINILMNAVEAEEQEGGEIKIDAEECEGMAVITVSDNGPGIPAEQMHRIFDPFYSTKPNGSGLGLAVSYRVAREHHGNIQIDSHPGRGTRVKFSLPVEQKAYTKKADSAGLREIRKALVIDGNKTQKNILQKILEQAHLQVKAVKTLASAEKSIQDFKPDLVIFDECLHDGDPLAYATLLKQSRPEIIICMLGTLTNPEDLDRLRLSGIDEFFAKPFQRSQIIETLSGFRKTSHHSEPASV